MTSQREDLVNRLMTLMREDNAWLEHMPLEVALSYRKLLAVLERQPKKVQRAEREDAIRKIAEGIVTSALQKGIPYEGIAELVEKIENGS